MKNKILWFLVFSIVGTAAGYVFTNSVDFQLCTQNAISCRSVLNNIGDSLFYGAGALAIVFAALMLAPNAFGVWKKFAVWAIPIGLFLFLVTPQSNSGGFMGGVGFGPTALETYRWVSAAYVLVSLALIGWSVVRAKKA